MNRSEPSRGRRGARPGRRWRLATWLATAGIAASCGSEESGPIAAPPPPVDGLPDLSHIEPGTSVDVNASDRWSHRVIRSVPRLASGELSTLPESAFSTTERFRTVIAARVVDRGSRHVLDGVGVGNLVPVGEAEVVVTPDGPDWALDGLGVLDRFVLRHAEAELVRGELLARSPTFALYRTPTMMAVDGRHEEHSLHYALLVDPASGALTAMTWQTPPGSPDAPTEIILLPPDLSFDLELDVRVKRRVGPVPLAWSFAMGGMPPGRRLVVPGAVAELIAGASGLDDAGVAALERALGDLAATGRRINASGPPTDRAGSDGAGGSGPGRPG